MSSFTGMPSRTRFGERLGCPWQSIPKRLPTEHSLEEPLTQHELQVTGGEVPMLFARTLIENYHETPAVTGAISRLILLGVWVAIMVMTGNPVPVTAGDGTVKKHITIYGATDLMTKSPEQIASHYSIVLTEYWKNQQIGYIKKLNKDIKALFYRDVIGMQPYDEDWKEVSSQPDWFVKDEIHNNKIVNRAYGWYLMDITHLDFRNHIKRRLLDNIKNHANFDGVFLDDVPVRVNPDHFVIVGTNQTPTLPERFLDNYHNEMKNLLAEIKQALPNNLVVANTDDTDTFINVIDGIMVEGFIHAPWHSPDYQMDSIKWAHQVNQLIGLANKGKLLLVQSGSAGPGYEDDRVRRQFLLSFSSYLLFANANTSFYFECASERGRLPPFQELYQPIGNPVSAPSSIALKRQLLLDEDFKDTGIWEKHLPALIHSLENASGNGNVSVCFDSQAGQGPFLYRYLPLPSPSEARVTLYAQARGEKVQLGDEAWKRFGLYGRFCDSRKNTVATGRDLPFDAGSYEWQEFRYDYAVPPEAAYFFVSQLGFFPTATGRGWVSKLQIAVEEVEKKVFARHFTGATVFANPSNAMQKETVSSATYLVYDPVK